MIYVELFWNFLMIGALSFGGGYGMISLVRETVLGHGWLTEGEFLSFIAVSESTPGPLAINMATFIGSSQGGFWGALCATLGVVLPSFVIILLVASVLQNLMKYAGVNAVLGGVRPCVVAMILATAINMALSTLLGFAGRSTDFVPDARSIAVFVLLWALHLLCRKRNGKAPSPILMILISAGLGILFWGAKKITRRVVLVERSGAFCCKKPGTGKLMAPCARLQLLLEFRRCAIKRQQKKQLRWKQPQKKRPQKKRPRWKQPQKKNRSPLQQRKKRSPRPQQQQKCW